MSYRLTVLKDHPIGFWPLEGDFTDHSGRNDSGLVTGSPTFVQQPLVKRASKSLKLATGQSFTVPFTKGYGTELTSFSIEAWVVPTVDGSILSHGTDLLKVTGGKVTFGIETNVELVSITYNPPETKAYHVVGVYTVNAMMLFVDGELFDSKSLVPHTSFAAGDPDLICDVKSTVQALAVYNYPLSNYQIRNHYVEAKSVTETLAVPGMFSGTIVDFSNHTADLISQDIYNALYGWEQGIAQDSVVLLDRVVSETDQDGNYVAGTWEVGYLLDRSPTVTDVKVDYKTQGTVTVEYSYDGGTWTPVTNHTTIAISGSTINHTLSVRASFADGVFGRLEELVITGYETAGFVGAGRTRTRDIPSAVGERFKALEFSQHKGIALNGDVSIGADLSDTPVGISTLEVWVYGTSFSTNFAPTTTYVNGVAGSFVAGKWNLVHLVKTTPVTGAVDITVNGVIGQVAAYDYVMTQPQSQKIYNTYLGNNVLVVDDSTDVTFDTDTTVSIYAHDWTINPTG